MVAWYLKISWSETNPKCEHLQQDDNNLAGLQYIIRVCLRGVVIMYKS